MGSREGRAAVKSQPRCALTMTKRACNRASALGFSASELERLYLDELMKTEDAREGLAAFMENELLFGSIKITRSSLRSSPFI